MANMNKALKIALIVGGVGVTGLVGYLIYKAIKKKTDKGNAGDTESKERFEEDSKVKTTQYNQLPRSSYPETPFKSKVEGDKFRNWVNDNYPQYAKQIDLDRSGDFNNSYMRKAYANKGAEYQKDAKQSDISGRADNPLSAEFKSLLATWNKPLYYNSGGVAYFTLKFIKDKNATMFSVGRERDSECLGKVVIYNTTEIYLKGQTNDKRGAIQVAWNGKDLGWGYWENGLKKIVGTKGCLQGVTINNPTSIGKAIGNNCNMPNFVWC
jgi:hypothetical protein